MWAFAIGEPIAKLLLFLFPHRWSDRIRQNTQDTDIYVLRTGSTTRKPRMTLIEGVFATILFDLALFGTSNALINNIIATFTKFQNSWDTQFSSKDKATTQIYEFCDKLNIMTCPWMWDKDIQEYTSLNDFFARTYNPRYFPPLGEAELVSPACCTLRRYHNMNGLRSLLIKSCEFNLDQIGLPTQDLNAYANNDIFLGYLCPSDYHRVHSPIEGKCIYCKLESSDSYSSSVKFFGGQFNILKDNKRLVMVIESSNEVGIDFPPLKVALVVVGGVGVNTIVYNEDMIGETIGKGKEVASFRAGGSAIVMFSSEPLDILSEFEEARPIEVLVGESLVYD